MFKPYLQKKMVCSHKDIEEKTVADIAYKIYREVKTFPNQPARVRTAFPNG